MATTRRNTTGAARQLKIAEPPVVILFTAVILTLLGLVALSSASQSLADGNRYVNRQMVWMGLALAAGFVAWRVPLNTVRSIGIPLYVLVLGMLVLTLIPSVGIEVNGARRWLGIGPIRLQASEFAKVALIIVMASYLSGSQRRMDEFWGGFAVPCLLIGLPAGLILLQPDFGTAFLCGAVGFTLLFLAGGRLKFIVPSVVLGLSAFAVAVWMDPVRLRRVTSFLDIEANKSDGAYQLYQGILAFAAGGLNGVGVGKGRQQLSFLPEAHTDFIFATIGEELGLFFTIGTVCLFLLMFAAGVWALQRAQDVFSLLFVGGALLFITLQAIFNIGVVTGCFPTKGISLPFISYGGSNLMVMFVLVGLMLNAMRGWDSRMRLPAREL